MRVAIVLASAFLLCAEAARADSSGAPAPTGSPRFRWTQTFGGGGEVDRGPTVEVYDDRMVVAHFPSYMKRAGTHTMRLVPRAWEKLLAIVAEAQLDAFDAARVKRLCEEDAADPSPHEGSAVAALYEVHDGATTRLEVASRETRAVRGPRSIGVPSTARIRVAWYALAATAERHPGVAAVQALARVERAMQALLRHPDLERREERSE